jgi:hypothetical protein
MQHKATLAKIWPFARLGPRCEHCLAWTRAWPIRAWACCATASCSGWGGGGMSRRRQRNDDGDDAWEHGIVATGSPACCGKGDVAQPSDKRQQYGAHGQWTKHDPLLSTPSGRRRTPTGQPGQSTVEHGYPAPRLGSPMALGCRFGRSCGGMLLPWPRPGLSANPSKPSCRNRRAHL